LLCREPLGRDHREFLISAAKRTAIGGNTNFVNVRGRCCEPCHARLRALKPLRWGGFAALLIGAGLVMASALLPTTPTLLLGAAALVTFIVLIVVVAIRQRALMADFATSDTLARIQRAIADPAGLLTSERVNIFPDVPRNANVVDLP
jgi:hypothetical protein